MVGVGLGVAYPGWITLPRGHKTVKKYFHCYDRCRVEAIVEFDYDSQNGDELTIRVGDVISDLKPTEPGWMSGHLRGKVGVFPDNFVKVVHRDPSKSRGKAPIVPSGAPITGSLKSNGLNKKTVPKQCVALFAYTPQKDDELSLNVHDVVDVLEEIEAGWWKGCLNGKVGVFPSNFVEVQTVSTGRSLSSSDTRSSRSTAATSAAGRPSHAVGIASSSLMRDKSRPPPPLSGSKPSSTSLNSSLDSAATSEPAPELPPKPVKEQCRVLFAYKQQNEDELTLKEGDIVTVVSKESEDKGWWRGEVNGRVGVFPDNFVEIINPADKPVRPEKPTPLKSSPTRPTDPPSAPSSSGDAVWSGCPADVTSVATVKEEPSVSPPPTSSAAEMRSGPVKPAPPPILHAKPASPSTIALKPSAGTVKSSTSPSSSPTAMAKPVLSSPSPSTAPKPAGLSLSSSVSPTSFKLKSDGGSPPIGNGIVLRHNGTAGPTSLPASAHLLRPSNGVTAATVEPPSASDEFDAVERGSERLNHITAERARGPCRRRPHQLQQQQVSPAASGAGGRPPVRAPAKQDSSSSGLVNGSSTAGRPDEDSGSTSPSQPLPPWMKELQRAQNNKRSGSKTAECVSESPSADDVERRHSSAAESPVALEPAAGSESTAAAESAASPTQQLPAAPWVRELQLIQARNQSVRVPDGGGDSSTDGGARPSTQRPHSTVGPLAAVRTDALNPPLKPLRTPAAAAGRAVPDQPSAPSSKPAAASPPASAVRLHAAQAPKPAAAAVATSSASTAGSCPAKSTAAGSSDVRELRDECTRLRTRLDDQARQFNDSLNLLRADYNKRMRTMLDELDAEKKARLVMQVQLDRIDKLVKDINFTV